MKKRFKLATLFAAALFAAAPVATLTESTVSADASSDIMQQYTFNDSGFDFNNSLKVTVKKGRKFRTSTLKKDAKNGLEQDVPGTVSNQFLTLKYRGTAGQKLYRGGKLYKGKYLKNGSYKIVTNLVYQVVAKDGQSPVSTGPAYINGKKVYAQFLTGNTSGDEIIGIVYPFTSKVTVRTAKK
ncbi:hypothetical protein [uncultured Lactobacillus sp.]|uniref:hypothetical protein n=1 Tax=uncultured Lactobacillus sp. TaxID=153152 RepID=UPI002804B0C6|nr:hypothetical protein [uncultured Lactobacillus sp.]